MEKEVKKQESKPQDVFNTLNQVDCSEHVEKKGDLDYLSWPWAWKEVKMRYPNAFYTIYENEQGWNYHTDGATCWVKTGVTIEGLEHIEYLPVLDYSNRSIPLNKITSFAINTSIQRSITKACARHGLGLYIYAGEDLPDIPANLAQPAPAPAPEPSPESAPAPQEKPAKRLYTLIDVEEGQASRMIAYMAKIDPNDADAWAKGVSDLYRKYNFEADAIQAIQRAAADQWKNTHK